MNADHTLKAVSGLPCAYAYLLNYAGNYEPGTRFQTIPQGTTPPPGTAIATDARGNPMTDIYGQIILKDAKGEPIQLQTAPQFVCGKYNNLAGAYSMYKQ